ncbi:MAG: PIN domain-containing protein [Myxococcales bacterium]|nr:PIN domain-containing protein [Myxococcales bacterium]
MSTGPLILDTGGWLYALAGDEPYATALKDARPAIVPGLVLAEVDWHLRKRRADMGRLLKELTQGAYAYEPVTLDDVARAAQVDKKFTDLELGIVDASIVALAERLDLRRILTIDADFSALRMGRRWNRAFELAVPLG